MMRNSIFTLFIGLFQLKGMFSVDISQSDFVDGSLFITEPGVYELTEDIIFAPRTGDLSLLDVNSLTEPELFMFPTDEQREESVLALNLGFFAAIIIASDDVIIDLKGFTLSQSNIHLAMQRFFALIEIANAPFPAKTGPANFTSETDFVSVQNITIKNGIIGKSVHHGIHGNGCKFVTFEDLVIRDFEVAGISLNSADNVNFNNVIIEDSLRNERYNAKISQIIFILQAYTVHIEPFINLSLLPDVLVNEINTKRESLREVLRQVIQVEVNLAVNEQNFDIVAIEAELDGLSSLVRTLTNGIPDGSLVAGIIMHQVVNVQDFIGFIPEDQVESVTFNNVIVRNLVARPLEWMGVEDAITNKELKGMIGAAIDVDSIRDLTTNEMTYKANPIADFQLVLAKMILFINNNVDPDTLDFNVLKLMSRGGVTQEFIDWSEGTATWTDFSTSKKFRFFPNGDIMFHFNKGVIGIKLDQNFKVSMNNVTIENLQNIADNEDRSYFFRNLPLLGSTVSTEDCDGECVLVSDREYFGFGTRGVSLAGNIDVSGAVEINHLFSNFEKEITKIDFIQTNSEIKLELLQSIEECDIELLEGEIKTFDRLLPFVSRDELNTVVDTPVIDNSNDTNGITYLLFIVPMAILSAIVIVLVATRKQEPKVTDSEEEFVSTTL